MLPFGICVHDGIQLPVEVLFVLLLGSIDRCVTLEYRDREVSNPCSESGSYDSFINWLALVSAACSWPLSRKPILGVGERCDLLYPNTTMPVLTEACALGS